ncbi:pilus assembly protein CpaF [Paenibacillus sp. UNCCL117]|uniref:ATPase, T2SS/T4P/T4SS family n=1 Tax=unclassified Paenibacillus TaxID=185978 RepID=UPI00088E113D|nr:MULTISPECIES: ATPase, T2SS/T4P/T4SS family [unclassified Paenibacillus]SDE40817.1 pilus assembly protein CpaF [Paenibacillus sp. cl123]SFW65397.1 pilus assembly protein CpaF [Paenibacillus sp. UNCCL117]
MQIRAPELADDTRLRPRLRFDAVRYVKDLAQAGTPFVRSHQPVRTKGAEHGERRLPLSEAASMLYEHLTERSKSDQALYEDIIQAGLGEPLAQWRMKAVIETLLVEYRIQVEPATLIHPLSQADSIFAETCGTGLIEDLYRLDDVEEVQVIGRHIFLLKGGRMERHTRMFGSLEDVLRLQDRLALCGKKPINERQPFVQSYMWNRSRLVMTRPPYSDVPSIHIRNFIVKDVTLGQLTGLGTINERMAQLLRLLVRHHASMLIGGGTATGKTTFLFALAAEIPEHERIRTLEKEFEVALRERLRGTRNILAVREVEDIRLSMEESFKPLLVMSPHWVIVGEAKGSEVAQMVQGALRGHDMMGTMHTKYRDSFLSDVVDMIKQDGRQHDTGDTMRRVARAFNILIFLRLVQVEGRPRRVVTEITELSVDEEQRVSVKPLVEWSYAKQTWSFTGNTLSRSLTDHLLANGADGRDFAKLGVWDACLGD